MKKKVLRVLALPLLAGLVSTSSYGQEQKNLSEKINNANGEPSLIVFQKESSYRLQDANTLFKNQLQSGENDTFVQIKSETDNLGYVHHKYQQKYNGVAVEFATYTLHAKNGRVNTMSGEFYNVKDVNTTPVLTKEQGLQAALNHIGAQSYMWDNVEAANKLGYTKPEGELVLLPNLDYQGKNTANNAYLAYKYDIYATQPLSRGVLYIDAVTGAPLFYNSVIKHVGEHANSASNLGAVSDEHGHAVEKTMEYRATGNAATRYSGTRTITTRQIGSPYTLRDNTRGGGVNTYNSGGQNSYPTTNFTDANNDWTAAEFNNSNKDNAALDAHWGAEVTYDYWQATHSRNSFDGSGAAINSWVHYDNQPGGAGYDNAFWNGSVMTYGDGSSNGNEGNGFFDALTSLDVAAHEIGHAVTTNTANLAYRRESGGLNEGFSDIWGAAVEHYAKGNGNDAAPSADTWLIGDEIDRRSGSIALRSMSNPNDRNQPDTYGGTYWKNPNCGTPTQANDYCGVHTNSGVLNYWFYLSVVGGSGTNDIGNAFNVSGIGMDKSAKIAYRTLNNYLSANSTFANARTGAIQAAKDLYGAGGAEEIAVTNAWHAVGVGAAYSGGGGGGGVSYCSSNGNNTNDEYISRVQIGSINKTSGVGTTSTGYSDFTSTSTDLSVGASSTITITPTWTGTIYNEGYAVFIDYNQDGDFTDAGETVWTKAASQTTPVSGSFTVPSSATSGETRLRVSMKYNGVPTSCESFQYGEVEDYTVNITTGGGGGNPTGCTSGITSFPYSQGFENTLGSWTQASGDDFNWALRSGGTPSRNTGPSSANQGSYYIYMESSTPNYSTKRAILNSPCLNFGSLSSATITFRYHMYGSNAMGSLALEASTDDGSTWSSVWSKSGNQGNSWQTATVNLNTYAGNSNVKLRLNGVTGTTWQGDMAVDNLSISGSSTVVNNTLIDTQENLSNTISIYPNPVRGNALFVKSSSDLEYTIVNALGQQVAKGRTQSNEINVSDLKSGLYMIQFNSNSKIITKKFIKQ